MSSNFSLIIDFDSTIIDLETLEFLASFSLQGNNQKHNIIQKVSHYTDLAMNGEITFQESLEIRLKLMKIHKKHINETVKALNDKIDKSFLKNIDFFKKYIDSTYIVSGGFKSIIEPALLFSTNTNWNIFANELKFNHEGYVIGVNKDNPLAFSKGKVELVKGLDLKNDIIIIGDGYTDYEVKKDGNADIFIQYTENVNRLELNKNADYICSDFSQIIKIIKNV